MASITLSPAHSRRRFPAVAAVVTASTLALSGCFGLGNAVEIDTTDLPVGLDDAQSATLQITAFGEYYETATDVPVDGGWYGSGFIITPSGLAITNNHVAAAARSFEVRPGGGTGPSLEAEVLSTSECLDLAVLQLPAGNTYPFMAWRQGEIKPPLSVYSAGFPNGTTTFTLTGGIVNTANQSSEDQFASLDAVIEHDARIRGGNSGGPLIDEQGRVVGVNYAGIDLQDYNYAIAREQVLSVLDRMIAGEPVLSLGVNARGIPLDPETGDPYGVWVRSVLPGSPAEEAGLQPGDILVELDGVQLGQSGTLAEYCGVLEERGTDAPLDVVVSRWMTGDVLVGQFNGTPLQVQGGDEPVEPGVEEFVMLTDDTGLLRLEAPASWSDVQGSGYSFPDGVPWETLVAAPNLDDYVNERGPGALFVASEAYAGSDPAEFQELLAADLSGRCSGSGSLEYTDGFYTGLYDIWECDTGAIYYAVSANSDDGTHFIRLIATVFTEYEGSVVLDRLLNSFLASY